MKNKKRRGFTLVELLVVLLILGVLVGLAVPRYMDAQKNARFRTFTANVRKIQSTLEVYRMDKATTSSVGYPNNLSELQGYFTQQPVNPYTGKSMVTDNPTESGLQYTNNGGTYTLTVVQPDVDDINKNSNTTEPLPVALNVGGETETPTVTKDTEPPMILAATLTGTVNGEYREYDIIQIGDFTVSRNDTNGMILSITATDNAGISVVYIIATGNAVAYELAKYPDCVPFLDCIFDATSGTWQFIFDNFPSGAYLPSGTYTVSAIIIDVNGNALHQDLLKII